MPVAERLVVTRRTDYLCDHCGDPVRASGVTSSHWPLKYHHHCFGCRKASWLDRPYPYSTSEAPDDGEGE